ncbi:MAG: formimidoylglutamate deiminase [Sphingomonas sp.]|uniref:formimidoylglutamate deiminase n=1 Tax=Sphingomonas sp. TaxID=28214 RepID=UPI000DBBBB67|nr:formimidoylglutamate deiminase [Sphingomonas sp.]PZU79610.1 MAG: formimidoylglutamate deiminase [Sphingomonas sp.]
MDRLWFEHLLLPGGWAASARVTIGDGRIVDIAPGVAPDPEDARHAIGVPGIPNLHSHAFQRAMAGRAEAAGIGGDDSFWTWRKQMYHLVDRLTPEHVHGIAAMAQVEMLETGFTRVGEFHYLHNDPAGCGYAAPAAMGEAVAAAAAETGIGLTLLPVFYAHGDFGGAAPAAAQRRFVTDPDRFADLVADSRRAVSALPGAVVGIAPHSLRAATPEELVALSAIAPDGPVHIHIAEQVREVEACLAWSGQRPVAWLLDHLPVDRRWCLVHATHVDEAELAGMAAAGAVAGLCPVTEANLGDGLFPARAWRALGGAWGIGSDSNVLIDASEEFRLLEYGQRLIHRRRNVLAPPGGSTGATLFREACDGGARALGLDSAGLVPGGPADLVALRRDEAAMPGDALLDRWIFARGRSAVDAVWRGGRLCVAGGRHLARDAIERRYAGIMAKLFAG